MFEKKCPNCNGKSYSSADKSKWICPHCRKDITKEKAEVAR